jgi:hypothetical protein
MYCEHPCLCRWQLMIRLVRLRQLRVQTGVLDLQPPHNEAGTPCYRGAAGATLQPAHCCFVPLPAVHPRLVWTTQR